MPQYFDWLIEDFIIYERVVGDLTVNDLASVDEQIIRMMESSLQSRIHVMTDISTMRTMPGVRDMMTLRYIKHPRMGYFITQRRNRLEYFIGNTAGKILKTKYQFVKDLDDGIHFLADIDPDLPPEAEMLKRLAIVQEETLNKNNASLTS